MKSATNEHKGLMAYLLGDVKVLHFPMLTLIHYKGFTVIAMTYLPIGKETIAYGR